MMIHYQSFWLTIILLPSTCVDNVTLLQFALLSPFKPGPRNNLTLSTICITFNCQSPPHNMFVCFVPTDTHYDEITTVGNFKIDRLLKRGIIILWYIRHCAEWLDSNSVSELFKPIYTDKALSL